MRVALYTRVSTTKQADKDLSIPDQLHQMRELCELKGYAIVREFREEGASATSSENRPQFMEMMGQILGGEIEVDAVLGLTTSRLFRNHEDAAHWRRKLAKKNVRILAADKPTSEEDNPSSRLVDRMFAIIDEHESEMIGWHTHRGLRENARRGYWNGAKPPYGFRLEPVQGEKGNPKKKLAINEKEAEIVRRIFTRYVRDNLGAVEIAKRLNQDGKLRRGKRWTRSE